ncbi:hypothetical protein PVAP13_6KG137642 [Panicum virgatum]|uniref:Uncharacterized protein n=1 Tax=Panicum virgatum TaxID=38727 RepID=A0A8T0RCU5_PANVG|nr:hypothetical protein PVAP13_6KG137642 [Panicum virgatum]
MLHPDANRSRQHNNSNSSAASTMVSHRLSSSRRCSPNPSRGSSQAALLGAHLRDVRTRAEHDLALVDVDSTEGSDPAAPADLRLLPTAFLATRDGRADAALLIYKEEARDAPFDPCSRTLSYHLCHFDGREEESVWWSAAYRRLVCELSACRRGTWLTVLQRHLLFHGKLPCTRLILRSDAWMWWIGLFKLLCAGLQGRCVAF